MAKHPTISIRNDNGAEVLAQIPLIVSASRATDIPAFYSDWFFRRLEKATSGGVILSRGRIAMCHSVIHASSFSGQRILRLCCLICPRLKSVGSGAIYNILLIYKIPESGVISRPAASTSCRSFFITSAGIHLLATLTVLTRLRLRTISIGANLLLSSAFLSRSLKS